EKSQAGDDRRRDDRRRRASGERAQDQRPFYDRRSVREGDPSLLEDELGRNGSGARRESTSGRCADDGAADDLGAAGSALTFVILSEANGYPFASLRMTRELLVEVHDRRRTAN